MAQSAVTYWPLLHNTLANNQWSTYALNYSKELPEKFPLSIPPEGGAPLLGMHASNVLPNSCHSVIFLLHPLLIQQQKAWKLPVFLSTSANQPVLWYLPTTLDQID